MFSFACHIWPRFQTRKPLRHWNSGKVYCLQDHVKLEKSIRKIVEKSRVKLNFFFRKTRSYKRKLCAKTRLRYSIKFILRESWEISLKNFPSVFDIIDYVPFYGIKCQKLLFSCNFRHCFLKNTKYFPIEFVNKQNPGKFFRIFYVLSNDVNIIT